LAHNAKRIADSARVKIGWRPLVNVILGTYKLKNSSTYREAKNKIKCHSYLDGSNTAALPNVLITCTYQRRSFEGT